MSFIQFKVVKIANQSREIFDTYIYKTEDTLADVQSAGYFNASRFAESEPEAWFNGVIEVLCADGLVKGVLNGSGDFIVATGGSSENWACDAKPTGGGVGTSAFPASWRNLIVDSTIPHPEMVNPDLVYQGNGRYLNNYGVEITVKGFITANAYSSGGLTTKNFSFTIGLWDGANIVPDLAKVVPWNDLRNTNQASHSSGKVYSYELTIPIGGIFGFTVRKDVGTPNNTTFVLLGYQNTVRVL